LRPEPAGVAEIEAVYAVRDDADRNLLITQTYSELSRAMGELVGPSASWCTFSTWSSRTVGYFIRGDLDPLLEYRLQRLPRGLRHLARGPVLRYNRAVHRSRKRAAPRLLARGNREIFREIGSEFARFLDAFADVPVRDERRWQQYRESITPTPATDLFPAGDIALLRDGMQAYYEAMFENDPCRRAQLVLLGNILLAHYEQQRVDPIVRCALSLFPSRVLDDEADEGPLLSVREQKPWALQETGALRSAIDRVYAWLVTKLRMVIVLPAGPSLERQSELIHIGRGLPRPRSREQLYPEPLRRLVHPALRDAWNRYDRARGSHRRARAGNWVELSDRMNSIVNVFRARQTRQVLYTVEPLTLAELETAEAALARRVG
jgi:hypothetical protein